MPGGEEEAIPVEPLVRGRIIAQGLTKKDCPDLSASEGKSQVTGGAGMHRINRQSPGLSSRLCES